MLGVSCCRMKLRRLLHSSRTWISKGWRHNNVGHFNMDINPSPHIIYYRLWEYFFTFPFNILSPGCRIFHDIMETSSQIFKYISWIFHISESLITTKVVWYHKKGVLEGSYVFEMGVERLIYRWIKSCHGFVDVSIRRVVQKEEEVGDLMNSPID